MKDKEKIKILRSIIEDILHMAIRYADGRHTYAPWIVRDVVRKLQEIFPDFELKEDRTITPPTPEELVIPGVYLDDYLYDLFDPSYHNIDNLMKLYEKVQKLKRKTR